MRDGEQNTVFYLEVQLLCNSNTLTNNILRFYLWISNFIVWVLKHLILPRLLI